MGLGWVLVVSTAENRIGTDAVIILCGAGGRQCWEGALELLFGAVSKVPWESPQLLPLAGAGRASPADDATACPRGGTDVPAESPARCWKDRTPGAVPVLGRAKPARSWGRSSWFCKAET